MSAAPIADFVRGLRRVGRLPAAHAGAQGPWPPGLRGPGPDRDRRRGRAVRPGGRHRGQRGRRRPAVRHGGHLLRGRGLVPVHPCHGVPGAAGGPPGAVAGRCCWRPRNAHKACSTPRRCWISTSRGSGPGPRQGTASAPARWTPPAWRRPSTAWPGRGRRPFAVYLTSPDYLGGVQDIGPLAALCRRRGVPLLVDNAHGGLPALFAGGQPPPHRPGGRPVLATRPTRPSRC